MNPSQAGKPERASSIAGPRTTSRSSRPYRRWASLQDRTAPGTVIASGPRSGRDLMPWSRRRPASTPDGARPDPLSATSRRDAASQISQKASPPMPQAFGITTPSTAFVATAASMAFPPARRTPSPAAVARWCGATTAPWRPRAVGTGTSGPVPASVTASREQRRFAGSGEEMLVAPQRQQRDDGSREQHDRGDEDPVQPERVCREAGDETAGDLAEAEEDAVQAHDRASILRVGLRHVG